MQRITIIVPQTYNDKTPIPAHLLTGVEKVLLHLVGGWTRIKVYGKWTDEYGELYYDESFQYEILTEYDSDYDKLKTYAIQVCRDFDQKCILTTCETVQADFLP